MLPVIPFLAVPPESIPVGLVAPGATQALYAMGFDYLGPDPTNRSSLLFVQQYDSRREETVRNMRIVLPADATIDDVRDALYDAGWHAHKEHVSHAREAYLTALKSPPIHRQIGLLPSQTGEVLLAKSMPAKL